MTHDGQTLIQVLSQVSEHDIYEWPLLAQMVYSRRAEPTVLLLPLDDAPYLKDDRKPDWRIKVFFEHGLKVTPRVTISETVGVLSAGSPKVVLSRAVRSAVEHLARNIGSDYLWSSQWRKNDMVTGSGVKTCLRDQEDTSWWS